MAGTPPSGRIKLSNRRRISSGSRFEEQIGYSRAVVIGDDIWVSGTTGYDYATMTIAPDVVAQAEQTFRNIAAALAQAWRDEQARPPRAPRRPGEGEVPAERFGPTDRRTGSERK